MRKFSRTSAFGADPPGGTAALTGDLAVRSCCRSRTAVSCRPAAAAARVLPSRALRSEHFAPAAFFQDIFNSVVAALFLLIVGLFAVIIKTNHGTLAGGVLGLVLLVLCVVDAVVLFQKISISRPRERNTPAK